MKEAKYWILKITIVMQFHYIFIDVDHYKENNERMVGFSCYIRQVQKHDKNGLVKDEIR